MQPTPPTTPPAASPALTTGAGLPVHEPTPDGAHAGACRNCDAPLHGPYCAQCGQAVPHHENPTAHELVHDAVHEFLHLDGKIFATLRLLLVRPGELTAEYLRGRRARFVAPIRLYLTCSVLYFVVAALANPVEQAVERERQAVRLTQVPRSVRDAERVSRDSVARVLEAEGRRKGGVMGTMLAHTARIERDRVGFARTMRSTIPKVFFVFVPLFAWIVARFYRGRGNYPAHLYFALHTFAFGFAAATIAEVVGLLPGMSFVAGYALLAAWLTYGVLALRRVHGGTLGGTVARAAGIAAASLASFAVIGFAALTFVFLTF